MSQQIEISKLKVHPKNVRKEYRGIEELAESIKARGILQNLTVVPDPEEEGMYLVIIGNRRLTAAKVAGIETAPCVIAEMDEREQVQTMLLENMQRDDLTIYEQAQGFQMVLDLGGTEEELVEKTGFSKTTIRRRLNIAKLDQNTLFEKQEEEGFQLSLTDLYELEKVKDITKRDDILKNAQNSREITSQVQRILREEKKKEAEKALKKMLKKAGFEEAPENARNEMYTGKWTTLESYNLMSELPEKIDIKPEKGIYWLLNYSEMKIIQKAKKEKREKTPEEIKRDEKDSRKKKIKALAKNMAADRREFILDIISGKVKPLKDTTELCLMLWNVMRKSNAFVSESGFAVFLSGSKDYYSISDEERNTVKEQIAHMGVAEQTLIATYNATKDTEFTEWDGRFRKSAGESMRMFYKALGMYGYTYASDEEAKIVNGTHELYGQEEEK